MTTEFDQDKFNAAVSQWEAALRESGRDALGKVKNNSVKSADLDSVEAAAGFQRRYDEALVVYQAKVKGIQKDVNEVIAKLKQVRTGYRQHDEEGQAALQSLHARLQAGDSHANEQTQTASDTYRDSHGAHGEGSPTGQDAGTGGADPQPAADPPASSSTPSTQTPPATEEGEGAYSAANPNA